MKKILKWAIPVLAILVLCSMCFGGNENKSATTETSPSISAPITSAPVSTPTASPTTDATPTEEQTPEPNVSWTEAMTACEDYGKKQYPFGFKMHSIMGKLGERVLEDGSAWLKYEVTITNEFNAKGKFDMECTVNGSKHSPIVVDFIVY